MTNADAKNVSVNIYNCMYSKNLEATKQLVELFDRISIIRRPLNTWEDYARVYNESFYTYQTWKELVDSEAEQNEGFTEEECKEQLNHTIWQLPCGWYVQYV